MMILKVTKNQGFNLSLKNAILEKQLGGQIEPPAFSWLIFLWMNPIAFQVIILLPWDLKNQCGVG